MYSEQHKSCCLIAKVEDVKENAIIIIIIIVKCQFFFFLGGWPSDGDGEGKIKKMCI